MKKINKYIVLLLVLTSGIFMSCNDWLDVNDNPNTAESVEAGYLFNYAAISWSGNRTGGDNYIPVSMSLQLQADGGTTGGYWGESAYDISVYSTGNTWKMYYSTAGNNLRLAIEQAKSTTPENKNAQGQCNIMMAFLAFETTMLWGDVPFSEAWNNEIKYPKFDSQQEVLNGVLGLIDQGLSLLDENDPLKIDEYDIYFKGDISKWKAVANSLKFRTLMVMADADPSVAAEIGKMMGSNQMISSAAGNMEFPFFETSGNQNPKYGIVAKYSGGMNDMFFAHNNVFKPMEKYQDARIPKYFNPTVNGDYKALDTRENVGIADEGGFLSSTIGDYLYRADCPDLVYSYQEQLLLEAEVYARGLGVSQDISKANELFRAGVKAACEYYKADAAATETFLSNLPDLTKLSAEEALYEIHLQQWIDLMDRPNEAFVQWRRSGPKGQEVPVLTVPEEAPTPDLIRRWDYSPEEMSGNPNAPKESPKLWDQMWFDK